LGIFNVADDADILSGKITDVYFDRTVQVLRAKGVRKRVRAEFIAKKLPRDWDWAILAGLDEALALLDTLPVQVRGLREGTLFHPWDTVLEVEGFYEDFAVHETSLLGLICQASAIATQAARLKILAGDRMLLSFGVRRMHPAISPMIDRAAWIGGVDGVSSVLSAERLGIPPSGTMPHALILVIGDTVEATRAFREVIGPEVKLVSLIDTFNDEKFEALYVAEALGDALSAVRLDTPASRRGDFERLIREVRWELDLRGHHKVGIVVSGGLGEEDIRLLATLVQGFGVGTSLSAAPTVDFSMDIVEVEGKPLAKRGKTSGAKNVYGCSNCARTTTVPLGAVPQENCGCDGQWVLRTVKHLVGPEAVSKRETASAVRSRVKEARNAGSDSVLTIFSERTRCPSPRNAGQ
jgi:nicotinate phosphoribosyltransferase